VQLGYGQVPSAAGRQGAIRGADPGCRLFWSPFPARPHPWVPQLTA